MKTKKYIIMALSLLLCAAVVLPFVFIDAGAEAVNFDEGNVGTGFQGKKLSILGDSISTYAGVSNDASANSTISGNAVYYTENNDYGVTRADTWWQQAIDKLGMQLCVNNSWSGSSVMGSDSSDNYTAAWASRCQNLHNASTGNPDVIAVYLGTNDIKNADSGLSTFANNKDKMLSDASGTGSVTYKFSYYIRMVNKMMTKYPSAQIYLFTLLPNESQNDIQVRAMEQYNQSIRDLVTYYQGQSKKVYLVDLYAESSITRDFEVLKKHLANTLHPNAAGMDVITNCFLSSLVHNSEWATNPANWRTVEYDLTDVYVSGGQINTIRSSGSTDVPFSVSLLPTRSEYGMEVTVEALNYSNEWIDITSEVYSGGTVYVRRLDRYTYYGLRITAEAVYQPKNFRWELGSAGLESCVMDGTNYNISGNLTQNALSLENGSYDSENATFVDAQYKLEDTVLLRSEEPWVIEWKASGTYADSPFLFSGSDEAASRSNTYLWFTKTHVNIGYRNGYRNAYWNYNIKHPDGFDRTSSHVYRLVNRLNTDGSNMVYLYIDGTEIGAMNGYAINSDVQTGDLATQNWLSGRDLEFSYMGALNFELNNCSIDYIQVWEGGGFDTLRLQQLIDEYNNELKTTMSGATNYTAYKNAVTAAQTYLNGGNIHDQATIDNHVNTITTARNNLTKAASASEIYSVELINGGYVPANMPAGLKIITTPDIQKVQIGNSAQTLLTNTSSIQTMKINGVDTTVKVWLVSFKRDKTTTINYRIHALKDASVTASKENHGDATVTFDIPHVAKWITRIAITKAPTKTEYVEGDMFDPTGMELTAYFADGTSEVVTEGYTYLDRCLFSTETSVLISYTDTTYGQNAVSVAQPVTVHHSVSNLSGLAAGTETTVIGYFVGVADEGLNSDKELLLKDKYGDAIIAVRNFTGEFPDYGGLAVGDELKIKGVYTLDGSSSTPNKMYMDCYSRQRLSQGNDVTYDIHNIVFVRSWAEMQELFQVGAIKEYTYVQLIGDFYLHEYAGSDGINNYRLHMNADATGASGIKTDGSRSVCLRQNVMEKNLGADWLTKFGLDSVPTTYPGTKLHGKLTGLYTGGNSTYFQLTILDASWISCS